ALVGVVRRERGGLGVIGRAAHGARLTVGQATRELARDPRDAQGAQARLLLDALRGLVGEPGDVGLRLDDLGPPRGRRARRDEALLGTGQAGLGPADAFRDRSD